MKIDHQFYNQIFNILRSNHTSININGSPYEIIQFSITENISDINYDKEKNTYTVRVPVTIIYKTDYYGWGVVDPIYFHYDREQVEMELTINIKLEENKIKIIDFKLERGGSAFIDKSL